MRIQDMLKKKKDALRYIAQTAGYYRKGKFNAEPLMTYASSMNFS